MGPLYLLRPAIGRDIPLFLLCSLGSTDQSWSNMGGDYKEVTTQRQITATNLRVGVGY